MFKQLLYLGWASLDLKPSCFLGIQLIFGMKKKQQNTKVFFTWNNLFMTSLKKWINDNVNRHKTHCTMWLIKLQISTCTYFYRFYMNVYFFIWKTLLLVVEVVQWLRKVLWDNTMYELKIYRRLISFWHTGNNVS